MKLSMTALPGVVLIETPQIRDPRGWFSERFRQSSFEGGLRALGLAVPPPFVQENQSCSAKGVLRGLHYQSAPHEQGKLVSVVAGEIFDVAVDIRPASPQFGQWVGVHLSAANRLSLWVPAGFAHGFLALQDGTEVLYKVTDYYSPPHDRNLRWDDPAIGIVWPSLNPDLSDRDKQAPTLEEARLARTLPGAEQ